MPSDEIATRRADEPSPGLEKLVFLFTCFIAIPGLAVAFVGFYGLMIWISQILGGPPGAP